MTVPLLRRQLFPVFQTTLLAKLPREGFERMQYLSEVDLFGDAVNRQPCADGLLQLFILPVAMTDVEQGGA